MSRRARWCGAICYFLAATSLTAAADVASPSPSHRAMLERAGEEIMPFDLHHSMHIFQPMRDGGVQMVVVLSGDRQQIALVRSHLRKEAAAFARGDFSDPAAIHGTTMPGLAQLRMGARRIAVTYSQRANGASIRYTTSDSQLVAALHQWFAAQVADHGSHAMMAH